MKTHRNVVAVFLVLVISFFSLVMPLAADGVYSPPKEPEAVGVYIVNEDTGLVMYSKNADMQLYPASLTKIMTVLVILDNVADLEGTVCTMNYDLIRMIQGTGSAVTNFVSGEQVRLYDLLYCLMLASSGDGALLAAETVGGSVAGFVDMMNAKAEQLGCTGTHFMNPHGLQNDTEYNLSTPSDIYKITRAAREHALFNEIVSRSRYEMPATNKSSARTIISTNVMLDVNQGGPLFYDFAEGIKTGFTTPAGPCFVSVAEKRGECYVTVVMKSELNKSDGTLDRQGAIRTTKELFEWLYSSFSLQTLLTDASVITSVPVNYGKTTDSLSLVPSEEFIAMLPNNMDSTGVVFDYSVTSEVVAPVQKGAALGTAEILVSGQIIGSITLVAADSVERDNFAYTLAQIGKFLTSDVAVTVFIVLAVLIVGYIILNIIINKNKRRGGKKSPKSRPKKRSKKTQIFN